MKKITLLFSMLAFSFGFAQNGGDTCGTAVAATDGMTFTGTTITQASAGSEMGTGGDSAWFMYTATGNGTLYINSCDGGADTYVSIGTGACGALAVSAQNDDSCASGLGNNYASEITIAVTSGTVYYIEWDDRYTSGANAFDWSLDFTSCISPTATAVVVDDCANTMFSVDIDVTDLGDASTLTISNDAGVTATTGVVVGMYTVGPFTIGTDVNITLEHDGNSDCNVALGAYNFICPPANDDCADAELLTITTSCTMITTTTQGATEGTEELNSCDGFGNLGLWYNFVAPVSGALEFTSGAGTPGIVIYEGACGTFTEVAASCSNNASASISGLTPGTTYYAMIWTDATQDIVDFCLFTLACTPGAAAGAVVEDCANNQFTVDVDVTTLGDITQLNDGTTTYPVTATGVVSVGPYASGSSVTITVEHSDTACDFDSGTYSSTCPPVNDECDAAMALVCGTPLSGSTTAATDSGGNASEDVWFVYENLGVTEDVTISLCGSAYDTNLRVYSDCPATTQIATNDDSCALQSELTFTNDGTGTYYIMVEGYLTATGDFTIAATCDVSIPAPANDNCDAAEVLTLGMTTSGTTAGATDQGTGPDDDTTCDPFDFHADVWYSVEVVGGISELTVTTTTTGTSDEAGISVYPAECDFLDASSLGCAGGDSVTGTTLTIPGLDVGTYYIRVWSNGVAARRIEGTFDIVADVTLSTQDFDNGFAFTYYPNPVNENLTLKAQKDIDNVSVYNMLGQEVLRKTPNAVNTEVNMSALQSGAYFVKVTIGNATETIRVLKN